MDELNPPAIVENVQIAECIAEARMIDATMRDDIRRCGASMVRRGQLLIQAKQLAGKGEAWREVLKKHWGISIRSAQRYMRMATDKAKSDMIAQFVGHTHKELDDKGTPEDYDESSLPPLTPEERKRYISLIKSAKPRLGKKLEDGTKILSDDELRDELPPSCDKCLRLGAPLGRPCDTCAKMRLEARASLFDEPEDESDSGSPSKPKDPYKEVRTTVTQAANRITKLAGEDGVLYEALKACRLMDHPPGGTPKFKALAGVAKVISMVAEGETNLRAIKEAYDIASGGFVPPMFQRKH